MQSPEKIFLSHFKKTQTKLKIIGIQIQVTSISVIIINQEKYAASHPPFLKTQSEKLNYSQIVLQQN